MRFDCCSIERDALRGVFEHIKNSNTRTLHICSRMEEQYAQLLAQEKHIREMLIQRGDLPASARDHVEVIPGKNKVKVIVESCKKNGNEAVHPTVIYWV